MTRQKKQSDVVPAGEVVLVEKEKVMPPPPPPPVEIAPTTLNKLKPKRELSEKQKANLEKLIERNKQKALERRNVVKEAIPETIPENMIAVKVKPKRQYTKKSDHWKSEPKEPAPSEDEVDEEDGVMDFPSHSPPLVRQDAYERTASSHEAPKNVVVQPKVKPPRKKAPPAPRHKPLPPTDTETSEYSSEEDSSDSDDDYKVQKYVQKTQKRMETIRAIDQQMKAMRNPYEARGMSIF